MTVEILFQQFRRTGEPALLGEAKVAARRARRQPDARRLESRRETPPQSALAAEARQVVAGVLAN